MYSNWTAKLAAMLFARMPIVAAILAASLAAAASGAPPANLSLDRAGRPGMFRVEAVSGKAPMSRLHQWSVRLSGADGNPVLDAMVKVGGGMPAHDNGVPATSHAEASGATGANLLKGMTFSLRGWWALELGIRAPDDRTDRVTFDLVL